MKSLIQYYVYAAFFGTIKIKIIFVPIAARLGNYKVAWVTEKCHLCDTKLSR